MKKPVVHYLGGEEAKDVWMLGVIGGLLRHDILGANAALAFMTMSTPWWWPESFWPEVTIPVSTILAISLSTCGALTFGSLLYLRQRTIRSLAMKSLLHTLTHETRNHHTTVHEVLKLGKPDTKENVKKELREAANNLCQHIAEYFRIVHRDSSISASIRLAVPDKDPAIKLAYKTIARSDGMSRNRHKTSEPIPANRGIPLFLREEKKGKGVLVYYNIKAAAEYGMYTMTENDKKYPKEVATMMVAPLNAWDGHSKEDMIGLLHINSGRKTAFTCRDVNSALFLADYTATVISNMMAIAHPMIDDESQS